MKDLKTFDVLVVQNERWLSKLIRWFIGSKWTHVGLIVVLDEGIFVLESDNYRGVKAGIILSPISKYTESKRVLKFIRSIHSTEDKDIGEYIKMAGRVKYDYFNLLFKLPIRYLSKKLLNLDIYPGLNNPNRMTCSEFIGYVFKEYFDLYSKLSPSDIEKSYHFKEIK